MGRPLPLLVPADLRAARTPGQVTVRGELVVYTLRGPERIDLWIASYSGGAPQQLTESRGTDTTPVLAPDGSRVAFLRSSDDGATQACLLAFADGGLTVLTAFGRGVHDLAWYPAGDALVVLAEDDESPVIVGDPTDPTAIVLQQRDWRADGESDAGQRLYPRHLHRVPLDGSPAVRLTSGSWSARRPRVSADGVVHLIADTGVDADLRRPTEVLQLGPDGQLAPVANVAGGVQRYHLDDRGVLALGAAQAVDAQPPRWHDPGGRSRPTATGRWSGRLGDETDLHDWSVELDDCAELTTESWAGSTVPVLTASGQSLVPGVGIAGALASDGERRVGVLALGTGAIAPDVYALDGPAPRRLTTHGDWLAGYASPRFEVITVDGPAGEITVHLLHPAGAHGTPTATVLLVHGGPTGQWGVVPTLEAILLASAGYVVAMPNIRGSIDRGSDWVAALSGRWGTADADDCVAVCDHLVAQGFSNPGRFGVSGLSYGGFLTQWLIATTDRFAAAVSENGVSNQIAAWGSCDTGPAYNQAAGLGDPLTDAGAASLWAMSPLAHVADVHTPLLMLQADDDRTCPASDNEQFFVALRTLRRDVEYVRYPGESHLMQGVGRIDRRIDRHQRVLGWFERYLPA